MEHCPILRHLYSKSSWMGRVIPPRLLALPAELKQLCSSSLVVGSRNISMNGCLVHKQGCLSQPRKGFFTCSPVFTCFLVIGRRVGRRLVVSWVWVCGRRGTSTTPTTTPLPALPALPAVTALPAPMAYPRTPRVLLMWSLHVELTEEISALVMTCSLIYNLSVILSLNIANQQLAMTTHWDIKDLRVLECIHKGTINSCNDLSKAHR